MRLTDRVVVVVGAGQTPGETIGNGRAASLAYAREGAHVVLADRRVDAAEATRDLLVEEGLDGLVVRADVTSEDDCRGLVRAAVDAHGRIDVLHFNVGHGAGDVGITEQPVEAWDSIIDTNLRGFFFCVKHVLPVMREQRAGVITAISSSAALVSGGGITYKTSKAGMNAMVQSLAVREGRHGIRVNAIMPGLIDTPMAIEGLSRAFGLDRDELRERRNQAVPLRREMGTAEDIANAAAFLASDDAGYISGVALAVDGALTARVGA